MKETSGNFGTSGFKAYLRPIVVDWYIKKRIRPKRAWLLAVYDRAFLFKDDATLLLKNIDSILLIYAKNNVESRVVYEQQLIQWENETLARKTIAFYQQFPHLKSIDMDNKTSRKAVIKILHTLDKSSSTIPFKEYYASLNQFTKDDLFERLNKLIAEK